MITQLDLIEARLQSLIESSVVLFARGDAQQRLAHQLIEAAKQRLQASPNDQPIAPSLYTIYLHPSVLSYWMSHSQILETISKNLRDVAREYGVYFRSEPEIQLQPDSHLSKEGIRVEASDQPEPAGQTAAFAIPDLPSPSSIPKNAFLIYEGDKTFQLNQMVVNIGRRSDNHLILSDARVSRSHAQIRAIRGQYVLFDLNSTGGTMVNGRRIHQCALKSGDVISLSGVPLIYGEETDEETYQTGMTGSMDISHPDSEPPEIIE